MKFLKTKNVLLTILFTILSFQLISEEMNPDYQFTGRHLMASYTGCDKRALTDLQKLKAAMNNATKASGAQILGSSEYVFPPNGYTMVLLLSESHASIHTYPEFGACFIDLFTCGTKCSAEKFHEELQKYLKPSKVDQQIVLRK